jgi:hypothetical protein
MHPLHKGQKINLFPTGVGIQFRHKIYEECTILMKRDKVMKYMAFCGKKIEIMQRILKMQ